MPTLSFDAAQAAAQIIRAGEHWQEALEGRAISYGFRASAGTTDDANGHNEEVTFSRMSSQQIGAVTAALSLWSDVANIRFEAADAFGYTNDASMLFANYNDPGDGAGAFAPGASKDGGAFDKAFDKSDGDVWINLDSHTATDVPYGSFHFLTILHEIGHAIGLGHPGSYNAGPGEEITYDDDAEYIQDSQQYTVMSYFEESETGADFEGSFPLAPLLHDIAAVQSIYGANTLTRSLDTVYGSNSTANRDIFNFDVNRMPVLAIWDGGGTDTLSIANIGSDAAPLDGQVLDLNPGFFSSTYGFSGAWQGLLKDNITIAIGTVIENAIGSAGKDTLIGNNVANLIEGRGGDDLMYGYAGADRLDGGAGHDLLDGGAGNDLVLGGDGHDSLDGGPGADDLRGGFGDDWYVVDDLGDTISESVTTGKGRFGQTGDAGSNDTVVTWLLSYTLSDNVFSVVENLQYIDYLGASAGFFGTGNSVANLSAAARGRTPCAARAAMTGSMAAWGRTC